MKYVEVEAETEQAAVAEVERCITLAENDEESTNPTVAGLTSEAVNEAVTEFQSFWRRRVDGLATRNCYER